MSIDLVLANLLAWSLQITAIVCVGGALPSASPARRAGAPAWLLAPAAAGVPAAAADPAVAGAPRLGRQRSSDQPDPTGRSAPVVRAPATPGWSHAAALHLAAAPAAGERPGGRPRSPALPSAARRGWRSA